MSTAPPSHTRRSAGAWEVGAAFLRLGLTSFGGPIAHLGYFRHEFVERRRWLDEAHFAQLVALCQFLPGPASSQLGFSIGLLRAGWLGAMAAFVGFTLPSALLLFAFGAWSQHLTGALGQSVIHGLKLVAVAVVAQGVLGMARNLTPDKPRALMAAMAAALMVISASSVMQLAAVATGALLGPWCCRNVTARRGELVSFTYGRSTGMVWLGIYALLLLAALAAGPRLPLMAQIAAAFYRTGAMVFGGGHVVLPLLKQAIVAPGWIDNTTFLAGYGAAQAVPGPMFTLSVFLGEHMPAGCGGAAGAALAVLAIFAPGLLLVSGALPFWRRFAARDEATRMLAGVNAVVVGMLAAALYDPVWVSAVHDAKDFATALIAFTLLTAARWSPLAIVIACVGVSVLRTALSL